MRDDTMRSFVQITRGNVPRRVHRDLDGLKDDELGRRVMRPGGGCAHRFVEYPTLPVLAFVAAAPALGAAERAVELFRTRARDRVLAFTLGERQIDQPAAQIRLSTALATVRAARYPW